MEETTIERIDYAFLITLYAHIVVRSAALNLLIPTIIFNTARTAAEKSLAKKE